MTIKVIYNRCFGGFGISKACAEWMAERGHEGAIEQLRVNREWHDDEDDEYTMWHGGVLSCDRHDPLLVEAVETLGKLAHSDVADLEVYTLRHGNRYIIEQYDGMEKVIEPEDINWTHASVQT